MLSELAYGALLSYSPRGATDVSKRSRVACYNIKSGDPATLRRAVQVLREHTAEQGALSTFFGEGTTLVPMPRSAPLVTGALWPAERIGRALVDGGLAGSIILALRRDVAVPKSSHAARGERPGVSQHYDSIVAQALVGVGDDIVIVDDVVTKGSTALAAASRIVQTYPAASVRLFSLIRTKGLVPEIDRIIDPVCGIITLNGDEGNRQP